jgi:prepilin-type N-terminal cleavage/methylation domain-containing protein
LQANSGFTLIEVLLAIAIAAIVLVMVNTAFFRSHANIESIKGRREIYQMARIVMDRMIKDIACAYIPSDSKLHLTKEQISMYRFVGLSDDSDKFNKDSIYFTTTTDIGFSRVPGGICEVGYYLKETEDKKGSYTLFRREDPTPHYGITKAGMEMEIAEGLQGIKITYIDDASQEVKEWDLEQRLTLPKQVKITLIFEAGKESLTFSVTTAPVLTGIRLNPPGG